MWTRATWVLLCCVVLAACGDDDGGVNNANQNNNALSVCGNGVREGAEECDDGEANSDTQPDACRSICVNAHCGDDVADTDEECDGENLRGQTCQDIDSRYKSGELGCSSTCEIDTSDCSWALCGDGILDPSEECDDGIDNSDTVPDACRRLCALPTCGDGVKDSDEACDGTDLGGMSCANLGYVAPAGLACFSCEVDSTGCSPQCGNGVMEPREGCDDGNIYTGDGCSPLCEIDAAWTCDGTEPSICIPGIWVTLEATTFTMGSPPGELGRVSVETQHQVTLTHDFEIQTTEVTQGQFLAVMGYNPSGFSACGTTCPVERVGWHEAAAYCNALSTQMGQALCYTCSGSGTSVTCDLSAVYSTPYACPGFRLPTEAEWEFAARAGTTTATYHGNLDSGHLLCEQPNAVVDSIAWFCGNAGSATHPVAEWNANAWNLFDVLGNVREWVHDWYAAYPGNVSDPWGPTSGTYRVIRGGGWGSDAQYARAAMRLVWDSSDKRNNVGFRPAKTATP